MRLWALLLLEWPALAESDAGGASSLRKEWRLMLKEALIRVLTAPPNWLVLVFMGLDRYERWK